MADKADIANDLLEQRMAGAMERCRLPETRADNEGCEECGDEIPADRRKAAPWATTCIECQSIREGRSKHVRQAL